MDKTKIKKGMERGFSLKEPIYTDYLLGRKIRRNPVRIYREGRKVRKADIFNESDFIVGLKKIGYNLKSSPSQQEEELFFANKKYYNVARSITNL